MDGSSTGKAGGRVWRNPAAPLAGAFFAHACVARLSNEGLSASNSASRLKLAATPSFIPVLSAAVAGVLRRVENSVRDGGLAGLLGEGERVERFGPVAAPRLGGDEPLGWRDLAIDAEAMIAGKDHVVAGAFKNKLQAAAGYALADPLVAKAHAGMSEPDSRARSSSARLRSFLPWAFCGETVESRRRHMAVTKETCALVL